MAECKQCNPATSKIKVMYEGIQMIHDSYILTGSDGTAIFLDTNNGVSFIPINYCPFCGRQLKDGE